tara:strand:- start:309 stop:653 length:345 start_codon:yes stop_codon:yes gene_type:complete
MADYTILERQREKCKHETETGTFWGRIACCSRGWRLLIADWSDKKMKKRPKKPSVWPEILEQKRDRNNSFPRRNLLYKLAAPRRYSFLASIFVARKMTPRSRNPAMGFFWGVER